MLLDFFSVCFQCYCQRICKHGGAVGGRVEGQRGSGEQGGYMIFRVLNCVNWLENIFIKKTPCNVFMDLCGSC